MKNHKCFYYGFHHYQVRVFCQPDGKDGVIVLEDILKILYPGEWEFLLEEKVDFVKDRLVNTQLEEDVSQQIPYSAYPDEAMEFWSYCDDAKDEDLYEELGSWLEHKVCSPIEQGIAHIADTFSRFGSISSYATKTIKEDKSEELITIKEWIKSEYEIEIPWLRTQMVLMCNQPLSYAYSLLAEKKAIKSNGSNIYPYKYYGAVEPDISELLSGKNTQSIEKFKQKLKQSMKSPSKYNCGREIISEAESVKEILATKNDDEIIETVWGTTKSSSPNQYILLKWFLDVVRSQQRERKWV